MRRQGTSFIITSSLGANNRNARTANTRQESETGPALEPDAREVQALHSLRGAARLNSTLDASAGLS